ncbi:hypothetical protein Poly51_31580 [Rubripirellula tenax]|uniref:Shikimate dehydrogenase n=1 Tax=Rubripirellula tenax TaxID=2528015 RepID=A0A5C6F3R9_9BACT|nr:hypothetical protein [Rubripirellula tenax]TWU54439.1 hypothetical protein Poly51_31580 [Rubripirellula tenax]
MDGTTEPIIAVIGHPIAGNPSQFAIERALAAHQLDWRVLSFDVHPEHIAAALEGFKVTGIAGVVIAPSVMRVAADWYATKTGMPATAIDCLYRDEDLQFRATYEQQAWVDGIMDSHAPANRLWIGDRDDTLPISVDNFSDADFAANPTIETIAAANLIVLAGNVGDITNLDVDEWPSNDGSTVVVDLTEEHPYEMAITDLGYQWIGCHQRWVGMLSRCFERWTGIKPTDEVISDAIEEYLGV